jgi:hypothetical protein
MNWVKAGPRGGDQNAGRKPAVHESVHNVHTPFGRTNTRRAHRARPAEAAIRGKSTQMIRLRHVVTTTRDHERVKANNWWPETARKDPYP